MWRWDTWVLRELNELRPAETGPTAGPPITPEEIARPSVGAGRAATAALADLIDEVVTLSGQLRAVTRELHGEEKRSGARRHLLRELEQTGPQTVPQLARARSVTRQYVQALVIPLAEQGYVEFVDNPAHKRSRLVRLTVAGRRQVGELKRREFGLLDRLATGIAERDVRAAVRVMRAVREALT